MLLLPLGAFAQGQFSLEWALKNTTIKDSLRDTTLKTRQFMGGSAVEVPAGKQWKIEKILVSMGSYTMKASSVKHKEVMQEGERLNFPIFSTEAQLLDDGKSDVEYILTYREFKAGELIPETPPSNPKPPDQK
ncbi:MAG: hypothetical protein H6581_18070 [Bacteroidia bacterium]|nr:hypothetical protein [Bacteroidia bacterium]